MLLVMGRVRLDAETADRMLAGRVDPADAPPGFEAVGAERLLVPEPAQLAGEVLALTLRGAHHGVRADVHEPTDRHVVVAEVLE